MEAQSQQQVLETVSFERDGECSSDFSSEEDHSLAFIFDGVIEPYSFEPDGTNESSTGGSGDDDLNRPPTQDQTDFLTRIGKRMVCIRERYKASRSRTKERKVMLADTICG